MSSQSRCNFQSESMKNLSLIFYYSTVLFLENVMINKYHFTFSYLSSKQQESKLSERKEDDEKHDKESNQIGSRLSIINQRVRLKNTARD